MRKTKVIFIKNAITLTVTSLILRAVGMFFRAWLAGAIGSDGIGLYSQIFSVYMLVGGLSSAGINLAVTRLVSEELLLGGRRGAQLVMKRCIFTAAAISGLFAALIFLGADFISLSFIGDARAQSAFKILPFSLPFSAVCACIKGYFMARKKSSPGSVSQLLEQAVRMGIIMSIAVKSAQKGLNYACSAVVFGDVAAEISSCTLVYIMYVIDKRKVLPKEAQHIKTAELSNKIRHIALPVSVGRGLNSLLRTAESFMIPSGLQRFGMSRDVSLSVFGLVKGMALPLLFFPASLLNALATLLIPEMSEAVAGEKSYKVKYAVEKSLNIILITSIPFSALFFFGADAFGRLIYGDNEVGEMIKLLSPLVPLMYIDSISDGLLKGLDQQNITFRNSIIDSSIRLVLIYFILPSFGTTGFIGIMYLSNLFTALMNLHRLLKVSKAKIDTFKKVVLPLIFALAVTYSSNSFLSLLSLPNLIFTLLFCLFSLSGYALLTMLCGCFGREDL